MKMAFNILLIAGGVLALAAIAGRFYGAAAVLGFQATSLLTAANTCLLVALVMNSLKK